MAASPTALAVLVLILSVIAGTTAQTEPARQATPGTPAATPSRRDILLVSGQVPEPLTLTRADLRAMARATATIEVRGKRLAYEGVLLSDILKKAGAGRGHGHGTTLTSVVVATAHDGYQVVFSMGEIDPSISASEILVADRQDGRDLPDDEGPFRIVPPRDLHGSRGVRALARLELRSLSHDHRP